MQKHLYDLYLNFTTGHILACQSRKCIVSLMTVVREAPLPLNKSLLMSLINLVFFLPTDCLANSVFFPLSLATSTTEWWKHWAKAMQRLTACFGGSHGWQMLEQFLCWHFGMRPLHMQNWKEHARTRQLSGNIYIFLQILTAAIHSATDAWQIKGKHQPLTTRVMWCGGSVVL